jgi:hypothetical protein
MNLRYEKTYSSTEWLEQLYDSRPNYEQFILSEDKKDVCKGQLNGIIKTNNQSYDDASNKIVCLALILKLEH